MHSMAAYLALHGMRLYQHAQDMATDYPVYRVMRCLEESGVMLGYLGGWEQFRWYGSANVQVEIAWERVPDSVWDRLELSVADTFLQTQ